MHGNGMMHDAHEYIVFTIIQIPLSLTLTDRETLEFGTPKRLKFYLWTILNVGLSVKLGDLSITFTS